MTIEEADTIVYNVYIIKSCQNKSYDLKLPVILILMHSVPRVVLEELSLQSS